MKKVLCTKCGSDNLMIVEQLNPNDDITIRQYFTDAYASDGGLCHCEECNEQVEFKVMETSNKQADPWRCEGCGSLNVQQRSWTNPNNDEFLHYDDCDRDDYWCEDCEEHEYFVRESELMADIEEWFANHLRPDDIEVITGLNRDYFASDEKYVAACKTKWDALDVEGKIYIWHELTRDKSNDD